jgi:AraC-like DNA-binding protein
MESHIHIAQILNDYLINHKISKVYFADRNITPPMLAFVVNFPRITITIEGKNRMQIEQNNRIETIEPHPQHAVCIPPNCWNKPEWSTPTKILSILFGKRQTGFSLITTDGSGEENINAEKFAIPRPVTGVTEKILQSALELHRTNNTFKGFPQLIESLLHCCLLLITESRSQQRTKPQHLFQQICSFLQEHFQYEITRNSVAAQFDISPNHLSRLFRTEGNMTFSNYLTFVRIDRAKFMLINYDLTLNEITRRCGYSDIGYFCRVFKKVTRLTPTQYKHRKRLIDSP